MKAFFTRLLPALTLFAVSSQALTARDFTYQDVNYTVLSEDDKTCATKAGNVKYNNYLGTIHTPGSKVSGELILPETVYDGEVAYTLTNISYMSFYGCEDLTGVSFGSSVKYIGEDAFDGTAIKEVVCPGDIEAISSGAFPALDKLEFMSDATLAGEAPGAALIIFHKNLTASSTTFRWEKEDSKILCLSSQRNKITNYKGSVHCLDLPYEINVKNLILGCRLELTANPYFDGDASALKFEAKVETTDQILTYPVTPATSTLITGLEPVNIYKSTLNWEGTLPELYARELPFTISTGIPTCTFQYATTQTTAKISDLDITVDESISAGYRTGIYFNYSSSPSAYEGKALEFKGLTPNTSYSVMPYITTKEGLDIALASKKISTKSVSISIRNLVEAPTTAHLQVSCNAGDATVESMTWTDIESPATERILTGLTPESSKTYTFSVRASGKKFTQNIDVKTSALELTTLDPKVAALGTAIVAAETNISEDEPSVGFQWKKVDAPANLKPSEAFAAIYDGTLEGYIKNLQPTSYYNVRAFYKDAQDNYYCSEWVAVDPSDFSYFEPTVHTYEAFDVTENSARIKGYALGGTDAIISQGFQYWLAAAGSYIRPAAPQEKDILTVEAEGQVMYATLKDLQAGAEYVCRSFVKTESGYTFGEEQTFRTKEISGINGVEVSEDATSVIGYIDFSGRRHDTPVKGFNIEVRSDGSTRKIISR